MLCSRRTALPPQAPKGVLQTTPCNTTTGLPHLRAALGTCQVWARLLTPAPNATRAVAVALYNGGNTQATIQFSFALVLGRGDDSRKKSLPGTSTSDAGSSTHLRVRDVWDRKDVPGRFSTNGQFSSLVESHATRLLLVTVSQ